MKIGSMEIRMGANEVVLGAVVFITLLLCWVSVPVSNMDMFKQGFGALIAWGAGYAAGAAKKEMANERINPSATGNP